MPPCAAPGGPSYTRGTTMGDTTPSSASNTRTRNPDGCAGPQPKHRSNASAGPGERRCSTRPAKKSRNATGSSVLTAQQCNIEDDTIAATGAVYLPGTPRCIQSIAVCHGCYDVISLT